MSGKFVRASKYRHVFGQAVKKELQYENIKVTNNAWDSNIIKTNGKYISCNWNASGGGAFAVIPVSEVGRAPDQVPLFRGHTAQVLDTDFDPFNDQRIVSASDDGKIGVWDIPEDYSFHNYLDEEEEQPKNVAPTKFLSGHSRKVGHVLFHPIAQNVLASSSLDYTVKIWNVETGEAKITLKHPEMVTSMSFSYDGKFIATVARDKKLRIWNIREEKVVSEGKAHDGAKNQRVVWLGNSDRLATTGFSRLSDRQIGIWDAFNLDKGNLGGFYNVDQSAGILMPFFDDGNKILYIAGKGDGNIRYYEFQNDELYELSEFQSVEAQRGFAVAPKRMVNVKDTEVLKCFKTVVDQRIEPISFHVPRKSDLFQDDIYPDCPSSKPVMSAEEWFEGKKDAQGPLLVSMETIYNESEPVYHESKAASPTVAKEEKSSPSKKESTPTPVEKKTEPSTPEVSLPAKKETTPEVKAWNQALKTDGSVNELLKKSSEMDEVNDAEDPSKGSSEWTAEDDVPKDISTAATSTNDTPKKEKKSQESPKKEKAPESPKREKTPESPKNSKVEETPKIEKTPSVSNASDEKKETHLTPAATVNKSMGLKQSVEKLSELVIHLESVVEKLNQSNLEKDTRLKDLEDKIDNLLKKQEN